MQRQIKEVLAFSRATAEVQTFSIKSPHQPYQTSCHSSSPGPAGFITLEHNCCSQELVLLCYLVTLQGRFCFGHLEEAPCDSAARFPLQTARFSLQTHTASPQNALQLLRASVQTIKQQFAVKTFAKQTLGRVITPSMSFTTSIPVLL